MEIMRLMNAVVRKLWLIILLAVVGGFIAGFFSIALSIPTYEADATLLAINTYKTALTGQGLDSQDITVSQQLLTNYGDIISSYSVTSSALSELQNYKLTANDLHNMVSIDMKKDSNLMEVKAIAPDPKMAAAIANAVSRAFVSKVAELTNSQSIQILDTAKVPEAPVPTGHGKKILIGFLAGIAIAFGIIYTKELFDTTVRMPEDIEQGLGLGIIGIIPEHDLR